MSDSSVLEYARYHGLASDHRPESLIHNLLRDCIHNHHFDFESADEAILPPLYPDFSSLAPSLAEPKPQLSRAGGAFLAASVRPPKFSPQWEKYLPDPHRKRKLKLEIPLLATDHDEDVAAVKCGVKQALD